MPDLPTLDSIYPGFESANWYALFVPAGTPAAIVSRLNGVINEALKSPEMNDTLVKFGSEAKITSPQDFTAFLAGETKKWGEVAKAARVQID